MSSGSSLRKLNPRSGASSCIDDTPRSARIRPPPQPLARPARPPGPVVAVHHGHALAEVRETLPRDLHRRGIAIDPDQPRRTRLEQRTRVSCEADRAIDEDSATRRRRCSQHLRDQEPARAHSRDARAKSRARPGSTRRRPSTARWRAWRRRALRSTLRGNRCARTPGLRRESTRSRAAWGNHHTALAVEFRRLAPVIDAVDELSPRRRVLGAFLSLSSISTQTCKG